MKANEFDARFDACEDIQGGLPVFAGTRVPVSYLIDYLSAGKSLDAFLREYPSVERHVAAEALEDIKRIVAAELDSVSPESNEQALSAAQAAELDRRLADFERDPSAGESWDVFRARLERRLRQRPAAEGLESNINK